MSEQQNFKKRFQILKWASFSFLKKNITLNAFSIQVFWNLAKKRVFWIFELFLKGFEKWRMLASLGLTALFYFNL